MTGERSTFSELDVNVHGTVRFGDGSVVAIEGCGSVVFNCKNGEHRALTGVYFIPRLQANIISLGQLEEGGCRIVLDAGVLSIHEPGGKLLTRVKRSPTRLYLLELNIGRPVCLSARSTETAWRWHSRYGHVSFQSLRRLAHHDMVRGLPPLEQIEQLCDVCLAGKHRRSPFPEQAHRRAIGLLDLVHGDLCGPISPTTPSGNKYFLLLVDDLSRYMWLVLLPSKDHAACAIKNFQAGIEVETGRKLKVLRTDRGGNSPLLSLAGTVQSAACTGSSPLLIPRSRMGWWNAGTRVSWPWRAACSKPRTCLDTSGGKPSPPLCTS